MMSCSNGSRSWTSRGCNAPRDIAGTVIFKMSPTVFHILISLFYQSLLVSIFYQHIP